ncbi:MAG: tRNA threonylcarbamoyladenosine dehydratase [Deltaproteobacteria bacterium]|nr:MAG: tRNA threonylcarbamoyladenosine dehydratase [Deltaproteobacteria bacterium]
MNLEFSSTAFSRLELLFGEDGLKRLKNAHVAIVGLGAVGSFAAEALARTAVGRITLIDFDLVGETNINRQLFALHSTIGKPKVEVAASRLLDINPNIKLDCQQVFYHQDTAAELLGGRDFDFLIDAIDGAAPKLDLIRNCLERKINFISAMGAAGRSQPTLVEIGDLLLTSGCPLARVMRKQLRREGVKKGEVAVVYSPEPIAVESCDPESCEEEEREEFFQRGRRRRIQPSAIFMPGVFGLLAAQYAVDEILNSSL